MTAAPLFILLNAGSGHNDTAETHATIDGLLAASGRQYEIRQVDRPGDLKRLAEETVAKAIAIGGVVVAAGGDGTINTIAQAALHANCPFGVLPQGTFNYFGRTHGIPEDTAEAVQALLAATVQPVQVGLVNDKLFLVNASLGLYPEILEDREAYKSKYGRSRFVALIAGIATILKQQRRLTVSLEFEGGTRTLRTPTVFVGNNALQMEQAGIPLAQALENGQLAGIVLRPIGTLAMLWLLVRGMLGQLGDADNVDRFAFRGMTVHPRRARRIKVATDGEVAWLQAP
ncbi:MAG TPA: diacylglycerol kinase family protein, partial [Burkholderiaceae bacterium]